jgi:hypothetical protein
MPIFSWSALVFGSTACEITGSGNTMRSSITMAVGVAQGFARGHVLQAHAGGDVAGADFVDFFRRLLACICTIRPMRSFLPRIGL